MKSYLGADILIATKAGTLPVGVPTGTVAKPLYDNSATGLQLKVTDSNATVYFSTAAFTGSGTKFKKKTGAATTIGAVSCPPTFSTYTNCYVVTDLLVNTAAITTGTSDTFTVTYKLPTTSTPSYENAVAKVVLSIHGVQFANQKATGCSVGRQCLAETGFGWELMSHPTSPRGRRTMTVTNRRLLSVPVAVVVALGVLASAATAWALLSTTTVSQTESFTAGSIAPATALTATAVHYTKATLGWTAPVATRQPRSPWPSPRAPWPAAPPPTRPTPARPPGSHRSPHTPGR